MIVDHIYRVSVFGNFSDITPTADNMMFFLESFRNYGLVPSIFNELKIEGGMHMTSPKNSQRIALLSSDNREQISISSDRIDYEITASDDIKLDIRQRSSINNKICNAYDIILNKFDKRGSRLALNTESFIVNLKPEEIKKFMLLYSNPISLYNGTIMDEWGTRLMVRKKNIICDKEELFNVITNLSKAELHKQTGEQVILTNGFIVSVDINTVADNISQRFTHTDIPNFINIAMEWWDIIISEMG